MGAEHSIRLLTASEGDLSLCWPGFVGLTSGPGL